MKKRALKNLNLKKRSISDLSKEQVHGGATLSYVSCWSCISCPSLDCTLEVLCNPPKDE